MIILFVYKKMQSDVKTTLCSCFVKSEIRFYVNS